MDSTSSLAAFIKYNREKLSLTQEMLAEKTGLGIHFIRDIEQGKPSLRLDKVEKVLALFGYKMAPVVDSIDPYQLWFSYKDKPVEITLKDRKKVSGFLVQEIRDERSSIVAWKIVPFPNILQWQARQDDSLIEIIQQQDIDNIELLKHEQIRKSPTSR
jgi:y4mF family transcriptional regulator